MATEIDRTLDPQRMTATWLNLIKAVSIVLIVVCLGVALTTQAWVLSAILLAALAAVSTLIYSSNRSTSFTDLESLEWQPASSEIQRQSLNIEIGELGRFLEPEGDGSDLLTAYVIAEDLSLRQIQIEHRGPTIRHVSVGNVSFDAIIIEGDILICVDVSFLVSPELRQEKIEAMLKKAASVQLYASQKGSGKEVRLLVVIITQLSPADEVKLRNTLNTGRFASTAVDIDIRFLDFEDLQRRFVKD